MIAIVVIMTATKGMVQTLAASGRSVQHVMVRQSYGHPCWGPRLLVPTMMMNTPPCEAGTGPHHPFAPPHLTIDDLPYQPTGRVLWRPSRLDGKGTLELYEAQSFMRWRHDVCFNAHITILARGLGIEDHRHFCAAIPRFNNEIGRWLGVDRNRPRRRWTQRALGGEGQQHLWIYAIEHSSLRGLHLHQLCVVPFTQRKAFRAKVIDWWQREACLDIAADAIHIRFSSGMNDEDHVRWIRYIMKSTARELIAADREGHGHSLREAFGLDPYYGAPRTYAPQLHGVCRALGPTARGQVVEGGAGRKYVFQSAFDYGDFKQLFSGWERQAVDARSLGSVMTGNPLLEPFE
jgi:hypothetical protein